METSPEFLIHFLKIYSVAHRLQKVPVTDGNSCPRPSPGCPLPWSPGIHKSAAGITDDLVPFGNEIRYEFPL